MDRAGWGATRGRPLNVEGDQLGVSFGSDGPSIGPVQLLEKIGDRYAVRSTQSLEYVLGLAFDQSSGIGRFIPALEGVARALNAGDLGQAMLRVQLMDLPVLPDDDALHRAIEAEDLLKASPDDPKHPGYPKGAPDGRGGQFRPMGADNDLPLANLEVRKLLERQVERAIARRAFREALKRILTPRNGLRALGELASNVDPIGPAEIGDALAAEQVAELAAQARQVGKEAEVAVDFVKKGPRNLEDLYASDKYEDFKSFKEFKKVDEVTDSDLEKRFGSAGEGYEWHHLAEQSANGRTLSAREVNSTTNVVRIPKIIHQIISAEYGSNKSLDGAQQSFRAYLQGGDFEAHREAGIGFLRRYGIVK